MANTKNHFILVQAFEIEHKVRLVRCELEKIHITDKWTFFIYKN